MENSATTTPPTAAPAVPVAPATTPTPPPNADANTAAAPGANTAAAPVANTAESLSGLGGESKEPSPSSKEPSKEPPTFVETRMAHPTAGLRFRVGDRWALQLPPQFSCEEGHAAREDALVLLWFDRSGSMGHWTGYLQSAAADAFTEFSRLNLVTFDSVSEKHEDLTLDQFRALSLGSRGCTSMQASFPDVESILARATPTQQVVIVVASDGDIHDSAGLSDNLEAMASRLGNDNITVCGIRVGGSGDTRTIATVVEKLGRKSDLQTVLSPSPDSLHKAICESMAAVGANPSGVASKLTHGGGTVRRDPFDTSFSGTVRPGELVFVDSVVASISINGDSVPIVDVRRVPPKLILDAVSAALVRVANAVVSRSVTPEEASRRLTVLEQMVTTSPVQVDTGNGFRVARASQIVCNGWSAPRDERKDIVSMAMRIAQMRNEIRTVGTMNTAECAEFIASSSQKNAWAKRVSKQPAAEAAELATRVATAVRAAEAIDDDDDDDDEGAAEIGFVTQTTTFEWLSDFAQAPSAATIDMDALLRAFGVVGIAIRADKGQPVQADAWNLRATCIREVYASFVNSGALAQAGSFVVEDPGTRQEITASVPVVTCARDRVMLPHLRALLDLQAAHFFHGVSMAVPNQTEALLACTVLGYLRQLPDTWDTCSEKQQTTMRQLCETFHLMCRNDAEFVEHCRTAPLLSGSSERHPNKKAFSVTPLRVLTNLVAAKVTGQTPIGEVGDITAKLYALQLYRVTKRLAGDDVVDRDTLLTEMLVGDPSHMLAGPLEYVTRPFARGPTEVTEDMLQPPRPSILGMPAEWTRRESLVRADINRVRVFLGIAPMAPDFRTTIVALGSKCEDDRPVDTPAFVVDLRRRIAQTWFDRQLKTQAIAEKYDKHMALVDVLVGAPTMEAFYNTLVHRDSGESKADVDDRVAKGLRKREVFVTRPEDNELISVFSVLVERLFDIHRNGADSNFRKSLARRKLILLIAGRPLDEFDLEEPTMPCFGGSPFVAMFDGYLSKLVGPDMVTKAMSFVKVMRYREVGGVNRHGHGNEFPSYFALDGGIPAGDDYKEHPEKYSAQQLWDWKPRVDKRTFAKYVYEHHLVGSSGLQRVDEKGLIVNKAVDKNLAILVLAAKNGEMTLEEMLDAV